ncbi:MAG: hypothetical protein JRI56_13125 [Deltaproteobacteria bacterium]|nr:hypothetical protein [Deltaproteobacteria bacterium]
MTDLEKALESKPKAERKDDGKLRMYLVLNGENAQVVKQALAKAGVINGNYAPYMRKALLNQLKADLAKAHK